MWFDVDVMRCEAGAKPMIDSMRSDAMPKIDVVRSDAKWWSKLDVMRRSEAFLLLSFAPYFSGLLFPFFSFRFEYFFFLTDEVWICYGSHQRVPDAGRASEKLFHQFHHLSTQSQSGFWEHHVRVMLGSIRVCQSHVRALWLFLIWWLWLFQKINKNK